MANWQQIGSVEVCVGNRGVTGVCSVKGYVRCFDENGMRETVTKDEFEAKHCQPPEPKHRLIESADGSVCVVSTEEQDGKPVRMAIVRHCAHNYYVAERANHGGILERKQDAIDRAARYVETGE